MFFGRDNFVSSSMSMIRDIKNERKDLGIKDKVFCKVESKKFVYCRNFKELPTTEKIRGEISMRQLYASSEVSFKNF